MSDIVERLREGCGCNFPETTCMAESECADAFAAADEITALRAEVERLREWNREIALNAREFVAENERLRAALEDIAYPNPLHNEDDLMRLIARAALEGR